MTMSTNHNLFEEKGEPKRNRAEALLLTARPNQLTVESWSLRSIRVLHGAVTFGMGTCGESVGKSGNLSDAHTHWDQTQPG